MPRYLPAVMLMIAPVGCLPSTPPPDDAISNPTEVPGEPPEAFDPNVEKLADRDQRDEAYRRVIQRQVYRGKGNYRETSVQPVRHVIVCPQRSGYPMFMVFPKGNRDLPMDTAGGHFVLVDCDGAIVRVFAAANSLDPKDMVLDVNGDGVVDVVHSFRTTSSAGATCDMLVVIPVTREQQPALVVAYNPSPDLSPRPYGWGWRLREADDNWLIELGPKGTGPGIDAQATFRWSAKDNDYVGPEAGPDRLFMRLSGDGHKDLDRFLSVKK